MEAQKKAKEISPLLGLNLKWLCIVETPIIGLSVPEHFSVENYYYWVSLCAFYFSNIISPVATQCGAWYKIA